jgi:hypothetical protein
MSCCRRVAVARCCRGSSACRCQATQACASRGLQPSLTPRPPHHARAHTHNAGRLEAAHALIDAYKHHLSDEVAAHHAREEAWLSVQQDWEKLEREFQAEIDA